MGKVIRKEVKVKTQRNSDKIALLKSPKSISPRQTISKKEKFRQKRKNLMGKFAALKKARKEEIARKNREKTAVIGDLKPLKDALPSLDELFALSKQTNLLSKQNNGTDNEEAQKKLNPKQKLRQKRDKFLKQAKQFNALLRDPEFKQNPRDVIAYHIKYTHGLVE